jgi:hypothetical protein
MKCEAECGPLPNSVEKQELLKQMTFLAVTCRGF